MADDNKKPSPPPPPPPAAGGKPDPKAGKPKKEKGRGGNLLKSLDQSKLKTNAKLIGGLIAVVISISGLLWFVLLQFTQSSTPTPPPKKPPVISEQQRRAQEQARQRQTQAQQRQAQAKAEAQRRAQRLQQEQQQRQQQQQQQRQSTLSTRSGIPAQQTSYYNQQQQQKHLRPDDEVSIDELPFSRPVIKQIRPISSTWGNVSESLLDVENQRENTIKQISLK